MIFVYKPMNFFSNHHSAINMSSYISTFVLLAMFCVCQCCLITNCPRGGKRNGHTHRESNIKQCIPCGPAWSGQCFGANICCGPFGCLMGTPETLKCQQEGLFNEPEPCVAGLSNCRKNTGRCASDGICCSQDSCHFDPFCVVEEKNVANQHFPVDSLYNLYRFPSQLEYANEVTSV